MPRGESSAGPCAVDVAFIFASAKGWLGWNAYPMTYLALAAVSAAAVILSLCVSVLFRVGFVAAAISVTLFAATTALNIWAAAECSASC